MEEGWFRGVHTLSPERYTLDREQRPQPGLEKDYSHLNQLATYYASWLLLLSDHELLALISGSYETLDKDGLRQSIKWELSNENYRT